SEVQSNARAYFDFRVEEIQQATRHRMRGYEQVLRGGVGLFAASEEVTRSEWREYVKNLRVEKNYPGIQGIGFSVLVPSSERERHNRKLRAEGLPEYAIWPEGDRPVYTAIIYLEPLDWRNQRAIGYDMYSEPVRREAMDKAVDNDMTAISGKVRLVQETQKDIQAGFLMYLPFYRKGMPALTAEERREALFGFVYSPFRMNDLMRGIIGRDIPDIDIEIFDGEAVSEDSLMYDGDSSGAEKGAAMFRKSARMELNGRTWTIQFSSLPPFEAAVYRGKPVNVFAAGSVISLLSFAIVFFMA
ncbi:MAG: CHASE domain-containing protein, partial [Deltaproteobacteria bacterium]|nr:CHASE domain-containing protein [Deltaproteobacteria bacterium]